MAEPIVIPLGSSDLTNQTSTLLTDTDSSNVNSLVIESSFNITTDILQAYLYDSSQNFIDRITTGYDVNSIPEGETTNTLSLEPLTFFLIIFFWTPSHFWALSLYKSDDYKKAKIPMLPLTNGIESTKLNIFIYSLIMIPVIVMPYAIDFVGLVFLIPSLILTFYYNFLCFELYNFKKNKFNAKKAKSIFGYSILYLFLIFVLFLIDKIL